MNDIIAKLYGGGPVDPDKAFPQARDPNWEAGESGDTVGGIGNTAPFGEEINWSRPDRYTASAGEIIDMPTGRYRVVETDTGFALEPLEDAARGVQSTINNMYYGSHHFGINPETGEVWYQQAQNIPSTFSQGMSSAPDSADYTSSRTPTSAQPQTEASEQTVAGVSGMPSNTFSASPLQRLNIARSATPGLIQTQQPSNVDYVQLLNQLMMRSLFKDLI